jgi:MFS transporter, NNP family, nitrate/nitrite transporter
MALGGFVLPNVLGFSNQHTGSIRAGWICYAALAFLVLIVMRVVARRWTKTWVGKGGRALESQSPAPQEMAAD